MFTITSIPFSHFVKAGTIPSIPDNDPIVGGTDANQFYFVAMYITSINKNPDGYWTPGQRGGSHPNIAAPYEFTLTDRKIVGLDVKPFTQAMINQDAKWLKVYEKSRSDYAWNTIVNAVNNTYTPSPVNIAGKGTDTVSFDVNMSGIVLDAPQPEETKRGEETIGMTFYFPMLITITTEPQLIIKHFTTTGQSLDGLFADRKQVMANGQSYTITPPGNAQYTYAGYKQANETPPSGGSPTTGNYQFTYDNTYNRKYVFLYYQAGGQINVRQMVRTSTTGPYSQQGSASTPVNTLPDTRTISSNSSYGTVTGKSLSYTAFSDTASAGSSVSVNLTSSQKTAYVTFFYEKLTAFSGDFDVLPPTINYRDSFTFRPKNFVLNGCSYISHSYKIERDGISFQTPPVFGQTTETSYSQDTYPFVIGVGSHNVYLKIRTSCGESDWIGPRTLIVSSPAENNPPSFRIGFVSPNEPTKPVYEVVKGTKLDLIYISDPSVPTPTDPDGDNLYFNGFDFASGTGFIQSIPSKGTEYMDGWRGITMDTLGYHAVTGVMRDEWGATSTARTYINVIPENPVPVATCPLEVIENHPVPASAFSSSGSYSPVGRAIDSARDEWTNRLASYSNGTFENITVFASLHVYDSSGLKSLRASECSITVKPDLPPVAKLVVPPVGIRNVSVEIFNQSTSPDGDQIVAAEYQYKYDANNNGFADEAWQPVTGTLAKINFLPGKVGKYLFYAKVTEDYGKSGDTASEPESIYTLDIVNNAPEVSFTIEGNNPQPNLDPYTSVTPAAMLNWPVFETNSSKYVLNKTNLWRVTGGKLVSGEGRNFGPQMQNFYRYDRTINNYNRVSLDSFPLVNNGYGNNRLSPWRSATSYTLSTTLVDEEKNQPLIYSSSWTQKPPKFRSNKKFLYLQPQSSYNSDTGAYQDRIVAIDPKKLSPIVSTTVWFSTTYSYRNGSPTAFVIKQPDSTTFTYNGTNLTGYKQRIWDWEMAGKTIYVLFIWKGYYNNQQVMFGEMATYDALTGAKLKSSFDTPGFDAQQIFPGENTGAFGYEFKFTKGENLVLATNYQSYSTVQNITNKVTEITPELSIVRRATWNMVAPTDRFLTSKPPGDRRYRQSDAWNVDANGAIYFYEGYLVNYDGRYNYNSVITKYNPDFSLAWRTALPYSPANNAPSWDHASTFAGSWSHNEPYVSTAFDYANNEIIAKIYYDHYRQGYMFPDTHEELTVIDAAGGGIKTRQGSIWGNDLALYHYGSHLWSEPGGTKWTANWSGGRSLFPSSTVTKEGYRTTFLKDASCTQYSLTEGYNRVFDAAGNGIGYIGAPSDQCRQQFGEYFGDGVYVTVKQAYMGWGNTSPGYASVGVSVGPPSTAPELIRSFTNGQFYSNITLGDAEVKYSFSMDDVDYDAQWLGFSFRMSDTRNRYSFETNGSNIAIAKYVKGTRTVLAIGTYPMQDKTDYGIRIKFTGNQIDVWLNHIPILNATDSTYASGRFGYFADKSFVTYGPLQYKALTEASVWSAQYAIWKEGSAKADVQYRDIAFTDPENDPQAGAYQWAIQHTPRFIDNQGLSAIDGQVFATQQLTFDKVGDYNVKLRAIDDPNPNYLTPSMVFDGYRKPSNEFTRKITVHRRPIADKDNTKDADGNILWTDRSRDPDRYASPANYSTEATGIDYLSTKGILEKRFYFVSPSGSYVPEKLITPTEIGTYEIGMAVKDEYGAWSNYDTDYITIVTLPQPNTAPVPGFTASRLNTFRGVPVTIDSTAYDAEDGGRMNLPHTYYIRNETNNGIETIQSTSRTNWTKTFNSLGAMNIRQVVEDSAGATAQRQLQVNIVNQQPTANLTAPMSGDQSAPSSLTALRPAFTWRYNDQDHDVQVRYQARIYRYGGDLQLDSNVIDGPVPTWTASADLPEKTSLYIMVRVFDGYDWSDWSSPKYFIIETNQPPIPEFDWKTKPIWEGDTIFLINQSADPDGDAMTYNWSVRQLETGEQTSSSAVEPRLGKVRSGIYRVTLNVCDGKGLCNAAPITHDIDVLPLTVTGGIGHMPAWLMRHQEEGHETVTDPKDFYAGETLRLRAVTASAPVELVWAVLETTGLDGRKLVTRVALNATGVENRYAGDMYDAQWDSFDKGLPKGVHRIRFEVVYANGVTKETELPFRIIGHITSAIGVQRRQ
ncbi:hypothetical protein BG53_08855 [Paenibacillus darwinianus]|uniref:PKD domain-containing protein n=2 Tax=Paenibacillus darwinianus TaxID=1380763 RepID=A0A9W5W647_9BACL|nr:hypothetical protein BG53_08855 [Paenibacillus darwinianus]EXX86150.1 hypothetical protein CH50_07870 [Paenibacillus darwinianus]EXX86316.1 hypothetical protein BG52_06815 [Paenibacillus darwinianus]